MSKWFKFASCNKFSPAELPVQVVTSLVRQGKSFNHIYMARSALSSVINQTQNYYSFDNAPIIKRYIKLIFGNNPILPKFQFTWNIFFLLFN